MSEETKQESARIRQRLLICSACVEIRKYFPEHNFCCDCVKSQPENKLSWQEKWLRHLDVCKLQHRGKCPNLCDEGKFLFSRASQAKFRIEMCELGIAIPVDTTRGN